MSNAVQVKPVREPSQLRRWDLRIAGIDYSFHTCARPGRSVGKHDAVDDVIVLEWAGGLPGGRDVTVVSLLGEKPNGKNEYSFYSFFAKGLTFNDWLSKQEIDRSISAVGVGAAFNVICRCEDMLELGRDLLLG